MKELFAQLADMCSIFHKRLLLNGFKRREALKLTQAFLDATINKPVTKSKEEK